MSESDKKRKKSVSKEQEPIMANKTKEEDVEEEQEEDVEEDLKSDVEVLPFIRLVLITSNIN